MTGKDKYGKGYSAVFEDMVAHRLDVKDGPDAYSLILPEIIDWPADRSDSTAARFELIAEEIARQIKEVGKRLEEAIKRQEEEK